MAASPCIICGLPVEPEREVYARPTCYACLLPPESLPLVTAGRVDEQGAVWAPRPTGGGPHVWGPPVPGCPYREDRNVWRAALDEAGVGPAPWPAWVALAVELAYFGDGVLLRVADGPDPRHPDWLAVFMRRARHVLWAMRDATTHAAVGTVCALAGREGPSPPSAPRSPPTAGRAGCREVHSPRSELCSTRRLT